MSQINHDVSQHVKGIKIRTDRLKTDQYSFELVFPSEEPFDGSKSLLVNFFIKALFSTTAFYITLAKIDIWSHFSVKDGFEIGFGIGLRIGFGIGFGDRNPKTVHPPMSGGRKTTLSAKSWLPWHLFTIT